VILSTPKLNAVGAETCYCGAGSFCRIEQSIAAAKMSINQKPSAAICGLDWRAPEIHVS
jgi:hypothetical protein